MFLMEELIVHLKICGSQTPDDGKGKKNPVSLGVISHHQHSLETTSDIHGSAQSHNFTLIHFHNQIHQQSNKLYTALCLFLPKTRKHRKLDNKEHQNVYSPLNIIIKSRRMRQTMHVTHISKSTEAYKIVFGKHSKKLALTLPTSGGRSVGIVRWRTQATEFSLVNLVRGQIDDLLEHSSSILNR
jgi:hypothetical protein